MNFLLVRAHLNEASGRQLFLSCHASFTLTTVTFSISFFFTTPSHICDSTSLGGRLTFGCGVTLVPVHPVIGVTLHITLASVPMNGK